MAIVHDFPHIVATLAHDVEPVARNGCQCSRTDAQPGIDGCIAPDSTRQQKQSVHRPLARF
jgi:hypothetical protein